MSVVDLAQRVSTAAAALIAANDAEAAAISLVKETAGSYAAAPSDAGWTAILKSLARRGDTAAAVASARRDFDAAVHAFTSATA